MMTTLDIMRIDLQGKLPFHKYTDSEINELLRIIQRAILLCIESDGQITKWLGYDLYTMARSSGAFARELMRRHPDLSGEEILTWLNINAY
jgi:hypothetical protein